MIRRTVLPAALAVGAALALAGFAAAQGPVPPDPAADLQHGQRLAEAHCAQCHAIGRTGASPRRGAPVFRKLHRRYAVADMEEALGEGIITGHPEMPEVQLEPDEVADFIAYLQSIQTKR